jgi:carbonic anhydrase
MTNLCKEGTQQSPINIRSETSAQCEGLCELLFYYRSSSCNIMNNGNNILLDYDAGSYVIYNNIVYELDKISFSNPSSNQIDSSSYALEMFLYHKSTDLGKVLILSVFVDVNDATSRSRAFFDILANTLPKVSGTEKSYNTPEDWNVYQAIPESKPFYTFTGSLLQSPCTENVTWIIMDTPVNISNAAYLNLKALIGKNSRKLQSINNRGIYFNPNTGAKSAKNYGSKLRCYTDEELRKTCKCMLGEKDNQTFLGIQIKGGWLLLLFLVTFIVLICYIGHHKGIFKGAFGNLMNFLQRDQFNTLIVK